MLKNPDRTSLKDLKERKKERKKRKKERKEGRKTSALNIADDRATPLLPLEKRFWASHFLPMRCVFVYLITSTNKNSRVCCVAIICI